MFNYVDFKYLVNLIKGKETFCFIFVLKVYFFIKWFTFIFFRIFNNIFPKFNIGHDIFVFYLSNHREFACHLRCTIHELENLNHFKNILIRWSFLQMFKKRNPHLFLQKIEIFLFKLNLSSLFILKFFQKINDSIRRNFFKIVNGNKLFWNFLS